MCLIFLLLRGGSDGTLSGVSGGGGGGVVDGGGIDAVFARLLVVSLLGAGEDQRPHPIVSVSRRSREGAACCSIERLERLAEMR